MTKFSLFVTASISSFFFGLFGVDWNAVDKRIDKEYPSISFVSSQELHRLYDSGEELPLIIDVREPEEFKVSHLPGAINLQSGIEVSAQVENKNREIVVYCSVGYRSAGVAADLQSLGFSNVRNLRHSVFEWANEGYPLQNEFGATRMAHPFNRIWGILLNGDLHQYSVP